jgi:hypothetical protein
MMRTVHNVLKQLLTTRSQSYLMLPKLEPSLEPQYVWCKRINGVGAGMNGHENARKVVEVS